MHVVYSTLLQTAATLDHGRENGMKNGWISGIFALFTNVSGTFTVS
jgi:hypothetical protein